MLGNVVLSIKELSASPGHTYIPYMHIDTASLYNDRQKKSPKHWWSVVRLFIISLRIAVSTQTKGLTSLASSHLSQARQKSAQLANA